MHLVFELVLVVLLADFVSGLVHWTEDTFWSERTPLLGRWIVRPNVLHHEDGAAFVRLSYLRSNWDLLAVGVVLVALAWGLDRLTWHVWVFAVIGGNANQLHKWAHRARRDVPRLVRVLQDAHVLRSPAHHAAHHGGEKNTRYCVVTELLNPVLDSLGFWRGLERLLVPARLAPRRADIVARRRAA